MIGLNPYLSNHNQYVSINGYESDLAALNCSDPQGSVLGPLLFLYLNDLNQAIKFLPSVFNTWFTFSSDQLVLHRIIT